MVSRREMGAEEDGYAPLFENRRARGLILYRIFAASVLVSILAVLIYRSTHLPYFDVDVDDEEDGGKEGWKRTLRSWGWMGMLAADMWFGLYWIFSQALRWNPVYRSTFKSTLSQRYGEELPGVDVFVCTADPVIEPPLMVVNTVLSALAYDYPPEKLSVYLSDDGGSDLTFYAMWEASAFARQWLPYCRRYKVEPRSPAAYFKSAPHPMEPLHATVFSSIKKLYEDMANRIEESTKQGRVPEEGICQHKGFAEWDSYTSKHDHPTILQILIDGKRSNARDVEGMSMPNLVYLAREKRPQYFHNFKAGAMNALIRVSSQISNGAIILNVDCDMYSNDSQSIFDALCFFMDEKQSQRIAYVQFPQLFDNITKNDFYSSSLRVIKEVDFPGLDGNGGPMYIGSNCFHLREVLCGKKYDVKDSSLQWKLTQNGDIKDMLISVVELEHDAKGLASCAYEISTEWGKEMGLKYGCPVEDVITGLSISCRGWNSVYYDPRRPGFLGVAPTSLIEVLVQHKRWSEGDLQILLSKYCPIWFGRGKISPLLQMGYLYYCCWACNSLATVFYSVVPSLFLIKGIPLFPKVSSCWFIPFAYIIIASYTYSLREFLQAEGTVLGWWNEQRIWLYKRLTSYLFAFVDSTLKLVGLSDLKFVITAKVADEDVMKRYMEEKIEFGVSSPMFTILSIFALLNLFSLVIMITKLFTMGEEAVKESALQLLICGALVALNFPLYDALFLRKDKGKMPNYTTIKSTILALSICIYFLMLI